MTLAEFLLARIAEDEAGAAARTFSRRMIGGEMRDVPIMERRGAWAWSPDRVLAECEAKRRIIDEHQPTRQHPDQASVGALVRCSVCAVGPYRMHAWPCPTLRLLALPYADRPDYDESWRP